MNTHLQKKITYEEIQSLFLITLRQLRSGEINVRQAGEQRKILSVLFKINAHRELMERIERVDSCNSLTHKLIGITLFSNKTDSVIVDYANRPTLPFGKYPRACLP